MYVWFCDMCTYVTGFDTEKNQQYHSGWYITKNAPTKRSVITLPAIDSV